MEKYKAFSEITEIDQRHIALGQVSGGVLDLKRLHEIVGGIEVNQSVPDEIKDQFNVARNMAIYTYFCYSIAPEVHMKTYSVMEMALRHYFHSDKKTNLKALVRKAVEKGTITDKGFRHVPNDKSNPYSKKFIDVFPELRNTMAHGTSMLLPDCIGHIEKCADLINQLFTNEPGTT